MGIELLFTVSEEDGWSAPRRSTSRACGRSSATCSTTPPRSAKWWSRRRPTSGSTRRSAARPRTPASAPRTGAAPSSPPRWRSRRCRSGGSTPRPPPTSARCAAGSAPPTSSRSAAACSPRPARSTPRASRTSWPASSSRARRRRAGRVRRRRRVREAVHRLQGAAERAELVAAEAALRTCGYEPRRIQTGGGSDANALQAAGFPCLNLANGTEQPRADRARVGRLLEGMLDARSRCSRRPPH